ncbi:MAG: hypothetical protein R2856_18740 [Caldilineaceae bacterium]
MVTPFLNIARGEDTEVDGEAAASFVTTIDWQAFVDSPYFLDQLIGLLWSQSGAMPSDAEMEQTITLAKMFGPALLEGIVVELVENVGLDSGYLLSTDFTFDWNLSDLAALSAMAGGAALEVDDNAAIMASIVTTNSSVTEDVTVESRRRLHHPYRDVDRRHGAVSTTEAQFAKSRCPLDTGFFFA